MARPTGSDRVLARFLRALDRAPDPAAVLDRYAAKFPRLAAAFRSQAADRDLLQLTLSPPPRLLTPGDRLGPFEVVRPIGPGGMGEVYEARDPRLGRTVALKVIRRGTGDPVARAKFAHEQEALARLHHTHIVPIHAAGEDGDVQYYAMAFLPGATFARVVGAAYDLAADGRPLPDWKTLTETTSSGRPRDPDAKLRLPAAYYRRVADVLAQAAEAVQHAHDVGVSHRDLKPSNLMADHAGHCWVIDFGLAAVTSDLASGGREPPDGPKDQGAHAPRSPEHAEGTPPYMAPEQHDGRPVPASDVWALGATLYELLTLRRAFDGPTREAIARAVRDADPRPPRLLAPGCPRDLAEIALKALRKDPADRYPSPAALAADLRRWLNREPTVARPGRPFRPVLLWAVRNKVLAAAVACAVAAGVGLVVTREAASRDRATAAEERRKDGEVGRLLLESASIRMASGRGDGWSKEAWEKVAKAAELRPGLAAIRDEAAATLVGLDAELVRRWDEPKQPERGWRGVAFSPSGRRVVSGGTGGRPTWLWDRGATEHREITVPSGGPVGFRGETAVQVLLPTAERPSVVVWDLDAGRAVGEFPTDVFLASGRRQPAVPGPPEQPADAGRSPGDQWVSAALTPDAKLLAAAHSSGFVAIWDLTSGRLVRRIDGPAAGVAVSPDGARVAVGGMTGEVTVWPLPAGDRLPAVRVGRTPVRAVALDRGLVGGPGWRLAAGDDGGTVCVWDEARPGSVVRFLGSYHEVLAVAFSPDGMTLASAGRHRTRLWDTATGRPLLELDANPDVWRDRTTGLAFRPDGAALGVGSITTANLGVGGVDIWRLDNGRGVRTLRGLVAEVSWVWWSADGGRLAALSHDWRVGVWDLPAGRLVARLDMPPGWSAENAGLAFGRDGRRLAFAAGNEAGEWDLRTGRRLGRWRLPRGLCDQLAYHPDGGLFLFRKEFDGEPVAGAVQLGLLRELLPGGWFAVADGPARTVLRTDDCRAKLVAVRPSPDGRYFAVGGRGSAAGPLTMRAYDAATGRVLWSGEMAVWCSVPVLDPTGAALYVPTDPFGLYRVIEMPAGRPAGVIRRVPDSTPGPGWKLGAIQGAAEPLKSVSLFRGDGPDPFVSLPLGARLTSQDIAISAAGQTVAWGSEDGTVSVWDVPETGRRLAGLGAGW